MLRVEDALQLVKAAAGEAAPRVELVPLASALGRTLAGDVAMDHDVPPFRRATMDGWAVLAREAAAGAVLRAAGRVAAGEWPSATLGPASAVRVLTGAPVPEGADAVVPEEWTEAAAGAVRILRTPPAGHAITPVGDHVRSGDVVLRRGTRVSPAHVGVLASAGCAEVSVAVAPVVAVLGTGSELVSVSDRPGPARIRNSNSPTLIAQGRAAGADVVDLGTARDEEGELRAAVRRGLAADVLLLSGGVSRGDLDLVPAALEREGVRPAFHGWAVQPGGPLWFGSRGRTLVFGLPGNPAASFVGFEVLVVPALRARLGAGFAPRRTVRARFEGPFGAVSDRRRYRPAVLATGPDGGLRAAAVPWKGSGDPFALAAADALVVIPEGSPPPAGGPGLVDAIPLGVP